MDKSFEKKIVELFKTNKRLDLLQYTYAALFVLVTLVAGLVALINQAVGVAFLIIPLICLIAFCMNLVVWSIVKTAVEHFFAKDLKKSDDKEKSKKEKKNKK